MHIPSAFVNIEIFNAHSTCSYSLTQNFGVKCLAYFSYLFPHHECEWRDLKQLGSILELSIFTPCKFFFTMPTDLYTKIYNFLLNAEEEDITAGSVIYQGIEDNPWISQNELKSIIERAVAFVKNQYERGSSRHTTLLEVLSEVRY
jgi:hypothetical protein